MYLTDSYKYNAIITDMNHAKNYKNKTQFITEICDKPGIILYDIEMCFLWSYFHEAYIKDVMGKSN